MAAAMQTAINRLTAGRTSKQRVVVRGSGSVSTDARVSLASYTTVDICGTINVTGSGSGDMAPIYARSANDIEVQHLTMTGAPRVRHLPAQRRPTCPRPDRHAAVRRSRRPDRQPRRHAAVDARTSASTTCTSPGASSHGVETYGVDGLTIGTVTARNIDDSGLLLNQTINATIGTVDAQGAGAGTGYAAFRMANRNGRVGTSYPTNIRVGTVIARGGGRGVFCVSESGGAVIDRVTSPTPATTRS